MMYFRRPANIPAYNIVQQIAILEFPLFKAVLDIYAAVD